MIDYRSLEHTPFEVLHSAWVEAFADYQVQIEMPPEKLRRMLLQRGFHPGYSLGAFADGRLVGFTLNGVRDWSGVPTAYDAGTAVVPGYRGQGIAGRMLENLEIFLRAKQVRQYLLEVIQSNTPAFELYRKKGFAVTREFACFRGAKDRIARREPPCAIAPEFAAADWDPVANLWDFPPSWQNSTDSVRAAAEAYAYAVVRQQGELIGYGVIDRTSGDLPQLAVHPAHRRQGIGASLLACLLEQTSAARVAVINVDTAASGTLMFLEALGFERFVDQYEMLRTL